jgi:hypothetical protein
VRLRAASVAYDISPPIAQKVRARSATVVLTARNVFLWTGFSSWDPENVTQSTDASNYNFGLQAQPLILVLRVNLGL